MLETKVVGGVHLPPTELHLAEMLLKSPKIDWPFGGWRRAYQWKKLIFAVKEVAPESRTVVLDIGAHVGMWSQWFAGYFDHVHAFEPVPEHRAIFPLNLAPYENWTMHDCALGDVAGTVHMDRRADNTGNTHVADDAIDPGLRGKQELIKTRVVRLDDLGFDNLDRSRIALIKIDVEGYELPVCRGAEKLIRLHRPVMIVEQKGNDEKFYGHERGEAKLFLESLGMFSIKEFSGDHIMVWPKA